MLVQPSKLSYYGEWLNDLKHGEGETRDETGDLYTG